MTREEYDYKMNRFIGTLTKTSLEEMFKVINAYQSSLEQRIAELETPKTCKQCLHHSIETEHYGLCHRNGFPEDTAYYWTCGGFIPKDMS